MKNKIHQGSLALARRIRAAGIPLFIDEDDGDASHDSSSGLLIYQVDGLFDSRAFDFHGAAGYIIRVVITFKVSQFAIAGFGLELPWKDTVRWLDEPFKTVGYPVVYRFGGKDVPEFERREVLNHRVDVQRMWSRGESLKGCLLGIGNEPIPPQFQQGAEIPAFLIIYDQFWQEYRSSISLWTDRTEKLSRRARSGISRRGRLFDHPDPGFEHAALGKGGQEKKT